MNLQLTYKEEYSSFRHARERCNNPNHKYYFKYGGNNIKFLFNTFREFLDYLGEKPEPKKEYSIERKDNNGNYEIGNVKWATRYEQNRNKKSNQWVKINNEIKCIADWCKIYKIGQSSVFIRMKNGWCDYCSFIIKPNKGKCIHIDKEKI